MSYECCKKRPQPIIHPSIITFSSQQLTLNLQLSTCNSQPSTLNQPATFNLGLSTLNLQPTRNPQPAKTIMPAVCFWIYYSYGRKQLKARTLFRG
ncbi:hypothetical protein EKH83_07440 [Arcticibacter tournemirensis]|uniref:Uncharacterized protein n=1 Tax=Arcticibacter tournemirensis TaxID=699437 RepID=A0A4Q0MB21_9SPHI|nr:hypothetical protein EKH83_07440 [Arcticibacter tournemirensis]